MRGTLSKGGVILLDDAERKSEQEIVVRWADDLAGSFTRIGERKPFFRLVV